jgi:hypothetical protein
MLQVVLERRFRLPTVPRESSGAALLPLLQGANARQVSADAAGKMRDLNLQAGQIVEQAAVDEPHRRHHQGEFPTEHPPKIVRIHGAPGDNPWQRMNEDVEPEIGSRLPEWAQGYGIELLPL